MPGGPAGSSAAGAPSSENMTAITASEGGREREAVEAEVDQGEGAGEGRLHTADRGRDAGRDYAFAA